MGIGALIGGAAAGLQGGWDDNREAFKEEAKRNFQMMLEEKRNTNDMAAESRARTDRDDQRIINKNDADQANIDILDPNTPSGAVAAANSRSALDAENRKYDRDVKVALAKGAGKQSAIPGYEHLSDEIERNTEIYLDPDTPEDQKASALSNMQRASKEQRALTGMADRTAPPPTQQELNWLQSNISDPDKVAQFKARFPDHDIGENDQAVEGAPPPPDKQEAQGLFQQKADAGPQGDSGGLLEKASDFNAEKRIKTAVDTINMVRAKKDNGESIKPWLEYINRYYLDESLPPELRESAKALFLDQ